MTNKETLFISEYLKDFNGTRAAKAAGYSEKSATEIASENLRKPHIKKAIDEHLNVVVSDKNRIISDNINLWRNIIKDAESSEHAKLKASEYLGKYGQMFVDRKEIEHSTIDDFGKKTGIIKFDD